ncbi:MAG TPA: biotin--[acetyl-CoA-carboxylase] ligase [Lentisphaeria bacterium]|nr:MAG: biotin--[acetyl-CoA-carboxylase] ligase [Lentisphaerae bacterium GWF2_38_69]HBM15694.1 biotin--[acetyl-CoA-carboxylase] ligase [Lentisphaeria bacterium]
MSKILRFKEIDSTNKYGIENFDTLSDRLLIIADSQRAGRGRMQKNWFSPPGINLYASFIIKYPKFDISISSWIGGLAALDVARELLPGNKDLWIKWPNDIYCRERKLAGVLCETVSDTHNNIRGVVIGIGININMAKEQLDSIDRPATSIFNETGKVSDIAAAYEMLLKQIQIFTEKAEQSQERLYMSWKEENRIIGRKVNVDILGKTLLDAKVIDIKRSGCLYVIDENGGFHELYSGDVSIKAFE